MEVLFPYLTFFVDLQIGRVGSPLLQTGKAPHLAFVGMGGGRVQFSIWLLSGEEELLSENFQSC